MGNVLESDYNGSNVSNSSTDNTTVCDAYQKDKYMVVALIAASSGTLSLLASLVVILIILIYKKYNFFIQRLILYLCIAAALNAASIVMRFARYKYHTNNSDIHNLCVATAFVDQTTHWSLTIAFACMTFNMLIVVVLNRSTKGLEMGYLFLIFIFPLMYNWIPFLRSAYGEAGAWCWIRSHDYHKNCSENYAGLIMQYALWYVPHYLVVSILLVAYIVIIVNVIRKSYHWRGLYSASTEVQTQQLVMKEMVLPIIFYPLGFLVLNLFPLVNRMYDTFHDPNYVLWVLHATFSPLQGGYIALVYVLDKDTLRRLNMRELRSYLLHRRTPVREYPATRGFTDSYDANMLSQSEEEDALASSSEGKVTVNKGGRGSRKQSYGSMDDRDLLLHSEKV